MWLALVLVITDASASDCEASAVSDVVSALRQAEHDDTVALAAMGFAEACRSPEGLSNAARNIANWPPERRMLADLTAALEAPRPWTGVCLGGHMALAKVSELKPEDQRPWLWTECNLARYKWFTESEWSGAYGSMVVGLEAGFVLAEAGIPPEDVRYLVRALVGLEGSGESLGSAYEIPPLPDLTTQAVLDDDVPMPKGGKTREAGFRGGDEPEIKWSKKARKAGGSCTVHIGVKPDGSLRKVKALDCSDDALRDLEKALAKVTLRAARDNGARVPGRFTWTVDVY